MKLTCRQCNNCDQEKFGKTKVGAICLMCFEKKVCFEPENETEKAQVRIEEYLARQTGGNNRRFTRGYNAIRNKLSFLENLPGKTEAQEHFIKGFKEALNTFETEAL